MSSICKLKDQYYLGCCHFYDSMSMFVKGCCESCVKIIKIRGESHCDVFIGRSSFKIQKPLSDSPTSFFLISSEWSFFNYKGFELRRFLNIEVQNSNECNFWCSQASLILTSNQKPFYLNFY